MGDTARPGARFGWIALLAWLAAPAVGHAQATFTGLGDLPGGSFDSGATGVSADGSVVVGFGTVEGSFPTSRRAFRWTEADGMVALGAVYSEASGVSANGSFIVGRASGEAFRWNPGPGIVGLGDLPGGAFDSAAFAISADGSVVVGEATSDLGPEPFRWTPATGMVGLGNPLGGNYAAAHGVSADGSIVVGVVRAANGFDRAFRWTAASGMTLLAEATTWPQSSANAVSGDGSVMVGSIREPVYEDGDLVCGTETAVLWTAAGGLRRLGDLPGGPSCEFAAGRATTADGSVVVGGNETSVNSEAFVWDEEHGMRRLEGVLEDEYGLDLTGWLLLHATSISADGRVIVGYGFNPGGAFEAWMAVLGPPTPPPTPACGDGLDNDGDGLVDLEDPGCPGTAASPEDPPCDDGLDNDGDGLVDFDDPACEPHWPYWEASPACGLGVELAMWIPLLWLRRPRARDRA